MSASRSCGGVAAGETVVSSATFLIDAESNLGAALGGMANMPGMDAPPQRPAAKQPDPMADMPGMDHPAKNREAAMLKRIIAWSVAEKLIVLLLTAGAIAGGVWAVRRTPLEALPDLSDVQVIVQADYSDQAPRIVEDQVTYPIAAGMLKVPGRTRGARLLVLRRVVRLRHLRGRHRPLLGAQPRARVPERHRGPARRHRWCRRSAPTRRDSAGSISTRWRTPPGRLSLAELRSVQDWYVHHALTVGGRRRRGRVDRRLREAVPGGSRSRQAARVPACRSRG